MSVQPVLECQTCGAVIARLSPAEAQQVSWRPYDFVVFCATCQREGDTA